MDGWMDLVSEWEKEREDGVLGGRNRRSDEQTYIQREREREPDSQALDP